jgi:hypothetical protein
MTARVVGRAPAQDNCEVPLLLEHESLRQWTQRCRATSEDRCRPCAVTYRRRVRRVADSGRVRYPGDTLLLVTLTAPSEVDQHCKRHKKCDARLDATCEVCPCTPDGGVHLGEWNGNCSARWNRFIEQLRRETGLQLQYFRGAEVQRRGALHFHVMVRLPRSRGAVLSVAQIRRIAMAYGFGHEVSLDPITDHKAAGYVAKYVSKSCADRVRMPWVHRRTGEVTNGYGRYRTWTSSREWGQSMKQVRAEQAAWWAERAGEAPPAQQAPTGPHDPCSHSYASAGPPTGDGGALEP